MQKSEIPNTVWIVSYKRGKDPCWPYDVGDDPSLRKYIAAVGPLSWGVCRPDVRNNLSPGDLVVFFCADRRQDMTDYLLTAFAIVERKVRQTEIWESDALAHFRTYQNLLIARAPKGSVYTHFEPIINKRSWHPDWAWRVFEHTGLKKSQFTKLATDSTEQFMCASNYIVFEEARTFVFLNPPQLAVASEGPGVENWRTDETSVRFKELLLGKAQGRSLRTSNPYQPHRHIRIANQEPGRLFAALMEICSQSNLKGIVPRTGWA